MTLDLLQSGIVKDTGMSVKELLDLPTYELMAYRNAAMESERISSIQKQVDDNLASGKAERITIPEDLRRFIHLPV